MARKIKDTMSKKKTSAKKKLKKTSAKKKKSTKSDIKELKPDVRAISSDGETWIGAPETDLDNPAIDPRVKARMERQARKNHSDNVIPFKQKDGKLVQPENMLDVVLDKSSMKVELSETLKYKLLFIEQRYISIVNDIKQSKKQEYQEKLNKAIMEAINADEECQNRSKEQKECVNEIMDVIEPSLPEGYAVSEIKCQEGFVECVYNPTQVGKRFAI